jgi:hypothetical protein
MNNKPEYGKQYALTGKKGDKCIANGNAWAESVVKCTQCGSDSDLMVAFTKYQICGKCTRKNHKADLSGELKPYTFGSKN